MKHLSIAAKIWLSIGVFVAGFVFSTALEQFQGKSTELDLQVASGDLFPAAQKSQEADAAFQRAVKSFSDAVVTQDAAAIDHGNEDGRKAAALINEIAGISNLPADSREQAKQLGSTIGSFVSEAGTVYKSIVSNPSGMADMQGRIRDLATRTDEIKKSLQATRDRFSRSLQEKLQAVEASSVHQRWIGLMLFLGSLALASVIVTMTIRRHITGPILRAVREISESAGKVASAAGQISTSSQSLAQGSSEQAASIEETSASSEEINSMARGNTENARAAADLVSGSQQKCAKTNQSLDQMVVAMGEIKTHSDKISKIIKVIDEIAFQTNILALNAAVEAARAGEAGMGFAVVAEEVRNLAQRCAQAARDTSGLIEESIAKARDGQAKVDQVAADIRGITGEVVSVKALVEEVSHGSQEQTRGIEQVAKAITQMQQVTQQTAANAEEAAAAAEELNAQSETLNEIVERLDAIVGGGEGAAEGRALAGRR